MMLATLPLIGFAQEDDMYFVPKKGKTATTATTTTTPPARRSTVTSSQSASEVPNYSTGPLRDVDEYNRRGPSGRSVTIITETDTFQVDESQLTLNEDGQYVLNKGNSSVGEDPVYADEADDYAYSARLSRFHGVGYPYYVWYDPWYYDPFYYDPWYYGGYWSYRPWGWYGGWGG